MSVDRLRSTLEGLPRLAIAVSGGVDSMTLAHAAKRFGPRDLLIVHAVSPAVPSAATALVQRHATQFDWQLAILDAGEFADDRYRANPVNRCYFCKSNLYDRIRQVTDCPIASGTNTDDLDDFRPGLTAAAEHDVFHPFVLAGMDKRAIRTVAAGWGFNDLAELPAQPCLSSRIETGIAINSADLAFVEGMESKLMALVPPTTAVRCRMVRDGVIVEIGGNGLINVSIEQAAAAYCATENRRYLGARPYRRGASFLRDGT
jgi:uncharacterized protein